MGSRFRCGRRPARDAARRPGSVAGAFGGGDQRQVQHVALRVAAAEARRLAAHTAQQLRGLGMAAQREVVDRLRRAQADVVQEADVVVAGGQRLLLRVEQPRGIAHAVGADEGHHRVQVVEGVGAGAAERRPSARPARPSGRRHSRRAAAAATAAPRRRSCPAPPARRCPARAGPAAPAPRRSGPAPGGTAPGATSCGTAKKLPSLQAGVSCVSQAMPSRRRSCISSTCATACQPQPSRGSSSTLRRPSFSARA